MHLSRKTERIGSETTDNSHVADIDADAAADAAADAVSVVQVATNDEKIPSRKDPVAVNCNDNPVLKFPVAADSSSEIDPSAFCSVASAPMTQSTDSAATKKFIRHSSSGAVTLVLRFLVLCTISIHKSRPLPCSSKIEDLCGTPIPNLDPNLRCRQQSTIIDYL